MHASVMLPFVLSNNRSFHNPTMEYNFTFAHNYKNTTVMNNIKQPHALLAVFQHKVGNNFGILELNTGNVLWENSFPMFPRNLNEGFFSLPNGKGQFNFYNAYNKELVPINEQPYLSIGVFTEGITPIRRNGQEIEVITNNNEELFKLNECVGEKISECDANYADNMLRCKSAKGKLGFISNNGNIIIPPKYSYATVFNSGIAVTAKNKSIHKYDIINKKGEKLSTFEYSNKRDSPNQIQIVSGGTALLIDGELFMLDGTPYLCNSTYNYILAANEEYVLYYNNQQPNLFGVSTRDGHNIIPPIHEELTLPYNNEYWCLRNETLQKRSISHELLYEYPEHVIGFTAIEEQLIAIDKQLMRFIVSPYGLNLNNSKYESLEYGAYDYEPISTLPQ